MPDVRHWAAEMAGIGPDDVNLPSGSPGANTTLNRLRLAEFLARFAEDTDLRDLLFLDILGVATEAEISSTGLIEDLPALALRPFRLWEYATLYKVLQLSKGSFDVLDLGGPASHLVLLTALAGNRVVSVDINSRIVEAGRQCAELLGMDTLAPRLGDMRDLEGIPSGSFDRIICCSVLEHLTAQDQERALDEMARVLRPAGIVGLTFDYGPPAPGANEHLPPPHEPPECPQDLVRRYVRGDLRILGNRQLEAPVPGSLFRDPVVRYVIGSLFLGKPPLPELPLVEPSRHGSQLAAISITDLPYRFYRSALRRGEKISLLAAESQSDSAARDGFIRSREKRLAELEVAAAERLRALEQTQSMLDEIRKVADRREEAIFELTAAIKDREQQIQELERTAKERLQALEATDAALRALQTEADRRERGLHELTAIIKIREQSIEELQGAAQERLQALEAADASMRQLQAEADRRAEELERTAEERLQALEATDAALRALQTEADRREQGLHELTSVIKTREQRIDELEAQLAIARAKEETLTREIQTLRAEGPLDFIRRRVAKMR